MHPRGKWSTALLAAAACVITSVQAPAQAANPSPSPKFTAAASALTADFSVDNGPGYAEVFGSGINVPALQDQGKLDALHQSGTRFIRGDAYLQDILPQTDIATYLANISKPGTVADPNTWDWSKYAWVDEHDKRGTKSVLILSYMIPWLGYGKYNSPPRGPDGFKVYEDVVRKIYQRFRGKVDLIEVWNEPNLPGFLDVTGTPYQDVQYGNLVAYRDIYETAVRAIRSVDQDIPIGGPAISDPTQMLSWVDLLLRDDRVKNDFDFLSYHVYNDYSGYRDEHVEQIRQKAISVGAAPDIPIYVTEWNANAAYAEVPLNANHAHSISYAALRLTKFLEQHAAGTNFFADNDESLDVNFFGVHRNGMLPPKSRVYRMMSQELGLGEGRNTLRQISAAPGGSLNESGAATNAAGDQVAWVVNDSATPLEIDLNLTGLTGTSATANLFEASPVQNAASPKSSVPLTISAGSARLSFAVPPKSVSGVRLTPDRVSDGTNLATTAIATASSVSTADPQLTAANVNDGTVAVHATGEWASNGELTPNLTLTWPTAQTIGRVILFDRANPVDRMLAGRLEFSDGSTVNVPELPNDGTGRAITFPPRQANSVKFVVTAGAGLNVGLSEIQVHDGANVVREGTITTSSQLDLTTNSQVNAVDGTAAEWRSTEVNPWARVDWAHSHTIDRVVLADRTDGLSNLGGGTLSFSDGTSIPVSGIPADGTAKTFAFPAKVVTWAKFQATGGTGSDNGLKELRVLSAPNLATSAQVQVPSVYDDNPTYGPLAATDGVVQQWFAGEWASKGQSNPWLKLSWPQPQTIGQVVLYDRNNKWDNANGGTLTFSDGSTVNVSGMDWYGTSRVVSFAPRSTTSVTFQVAGGQGSNVGLAEIQAFAVSDVRRVESYDVPGKFWRHRFGVGRIDTPGEPAGSPLADFDFRVLSGFGNRDGVTFESVNYPNHYLRAEGGRVVLQSAPADAAQARQFHRDITFHQEAAATAGWVSYRLEGDPANYLAHDASGALIVARGTGPSSTFRVTG